MVEVQAHNSFLVEDLRVWLDEHGLNLDDVYEAVIRVDRRAGDKVSAWLDASYYLRNADGNMFLDETGDNAATATAAIALKSWPPLTPG